MSAAERPWPEAAPAPAAGETHLWLYDLDREVAPEALFRFAALLDDDERARWRRFRFERDQRVFLLSHALVRSVLALYTGRAPEELRFDRGAHGKPSLEDPGAVSFNLSHSHGRALLAVCPPRVEVGVDIELARAGRRFDALARRNFAATEIACLDTCPQRERARVFYRFWALKEAYVKARATGLTLALDGFWFRWQPDGLLQIDAAPATDAGIQRWYASGYELPGGYAAAVVHDRAGAARAALPRWFCAHPLQSWRELAMIPFAASAT